ncbi:XK-related protein 8-like [Clupea harengus]|uniref:XK-related protein n=1 Tax=Clupea harengus TaxID=7950 RepID=A0A6P8H1V3_CLUHA|nr:XK-related protein 8-like [Clupea harengus]
MEVDFIFFYPVSDFMLNTFGLGFFFLDMVLDISAVVDFYQKEAYVSMGVLIFLLLGSSVLLQIFSWLWYNYSSGDERNCLDKYLYLEKYLKGIFCGVLHVCQLGLILRFAGMMEISLRNLKTRTAKKEGIAVYLTHDLSMLRLIETFSENAPQLTLMITIILQREDVEWVTGLKTVVSFAAISISLVMYHRSMRSFQTDKNQMTWTSSLVYFLWNFLLIAPRVAAIALFASTPPLGMIAVHFVCLWLALFLWAWHQKTDFMENEGNGWEWLYRATVALIWYFSWFNVSQGGSRRRSIIYHSMIAVDIMLLMGRWWWCWHSDQDPSIFGVSALAVFLPALGGSYTLGIIVKIWYYKKIHPNKTATEESGDDERAPACLEGVVSGEDTVTTPLPVDSSPSPQPPPRPLTGAQKRCAKLNVDQIALLSGGAIECSAPQQVSLLLHTTDHFMCCSPQ